MPLIGLNPDGYSSLGFDVVTSSSNSSELWLYLVDNRVPSKGDPMKTGADSVVHVFKGREGDIRLAWTKTYKSQYMYSPNDVSGAPDGKSFYWTNDHASAVGMWKSLEAPLRLPSTSVGYCHESRGCKLAVTGLRASNGITNAGNGTYYVAGMLGEVQVMQEREDNSFILRDTIPVDRTLDNIAIAADGALYVGGYPKILDTVKYFDDSKHKAPSSGLKITKTLGTDSSSKEKYQVETVFEDDGAIMPPASSVVVDSERKLMFLHGATASYMLVCEL